MSGNLEGTRRERFLKTLSENRRIAILCLLEGAPAYTMNDDTLYRGLAYSAQPGTLDQVRADMAWLSEQGVVRLRYPDDILDARAGLMAATLTARGADIAKGMATMPGIARPSPDL
ncbi:MAG: hypothetical protein COA65_08955 [Rhodospirillaceae bacterium]|nr:MAG: hypothetical protein COA65_08955 [Rhodospirillaceae bacterium]